MSEPKKVGRRTFLNYAIAVVATGVIVGAATYFAVPKGVTTVTAPAATTTVTAPGTTVTTTVTKTVTGTPTTSPTPSPTTTTPWRASLKSASLNVLSSPDCADFLKYAANEFMKIYSQVTINVIPMSWEALYPKILSDLQSKTGAYDLFTIDVMTLGSVVSAGAASLDMIMKKYPDIIDPNLDIPDFEPTYFGYGSVWAGEIYGLPVYPNHMFLL
jgi:ABC-type glycerol-3-phosphate transport system substrate-binding protein